MARTKLERYIDILKTLSQNGSLKTSDVACETKINYNELKKYLEFLLTQGLVNHEKVSNKRTAYSITHNGISVLSYFKEQKQMPPITIKQDHL